MPNLHLQEAVRKRKARRVRFDGLRYRRYVDRVHDVPRGTAVLDEAVVYGYPRIGRILALQPGIEEQFEAPFWAEEKVDGYNVRIFRYQGRPLAVTRGGFVCPFTTDRLPDLIDVGLFEHEPDLVICAEIAGPDNPYLDSGPPFVKEDVELFVFDMMRLDRPGFLSQEDKRCRLERYGLPSVEMFGRFTPEEVPRLREVLLRLNEEWREGVVLKEDSARDRRAKYVTSNSNIQDIRATAYNIMDLPPEYFTNRILRLVLFLEEQGMKRTPETQRQLGAAFLEGLRDAVDLFRREHKVYHTHRCRFRRRENAERLMSHLHGVKSHEVQVQQRNLYRKGGYWVLEFDRVYPGMNGLLGHLLAGGVAFD